MGYDTQTHRIRVNGVTLSYTVSGRGRDVVLLHGNGEDHRLFDSIIPLLNAASLRSFAPDSRGHGRSERVTEYHYADMAEDMYLFIRALGLEKPVLYGHSDGGIIGVMLELSHPGTLGLLAVSGANLSPEGLDPAFLDEMKAQEKDPLVALMLTEPRIPPARLGDIGIPVLVTAGERDLVLPGETQRIFSALPHGQLVTVKGADHGSYITDGTMGRLLLDFIRAHGTDGKGESE